MRSSSRACGPQLRGDSGRTRRPGRDGAHMASSGTRGRTARARGGHGALPSRRQELICMHELDLSRDFRGGVAAPSAKHGGELHPLTVHRGSTGSGTKLLRLIEGAQGARRSPSRPLSESPPQRSSSAHRGRRRPASWKKCRWRSRLRVDPAREVGATSTSSALAGTVTHAPIEIWLDKASASGDRVLPSGRISEAPIVCPAIACSVVGAELGGRSAGPKGRQGPVVPRARRPTLSVVRPKTLASAGRLASPEAE